MSLENLKSRLSAAKIEYLVNEPMSCHTTFKIGGQADMFVRVSDQEELKTVLFLAKECGAPCFVLGKGSNLLVSDNGIEGVVISLENMNKIAVDGTAIVCDAGANLKTVCLLARDAGLSGLEFAYGIPGSMGGALYMNAGAYGGEMSQVVVEATAIDSYGNKKIFIAEQMKLGYRTSVFKNCELVITQIRLQLSFGEKDRIKTKMEDFLNRRREKQPLEYPSAGSTFKRPDGYFAGALIEKNNLKGVGVGGAMVSEKHAGFVINTGNATCGDVLSLIKKVQDTVIEADGVVLEPEVIFVGRE